MPTLFTGPVRPGPDWSRAISTTSPHPYTLTDAAAALRAGTVTSTGLLEAAIAAADRGDPVYGAYLRRFDEAARESAARADAELAAGQDRGPLHGIPVGVKDVFAAAGGPTTAQSRVLDRAWWAGRDATVVTRLVAAGAVLTGKTTTMEFGCGLPEERDPFPLPRNPWRPDHWAGGSSSGTGIGVATGMFLAGLGSDTAGSIRMPAAFCGVSGLMPTYGRVPGTGCVPLAYSVDRIGPLARSARDCAAVLGVLAGPDPVDPECASAPFHCPDFDGDLTGLRIGVVREGHFPDGRDPALDGAFSAALTVLSGLGAAVREVVLPYRAELTTAVVAVITSEALAHHRGGLSRRWHEYGRGFRGEVANGAFVSGADYVQAQRVRRIAQAAVDRIFGEVDVIVCPTASGGAPHVDELAGPDGVPDSGVLFRLLTTPYWNGVANPVLAVPMGFTADGLPLSLQLAGRPYAEAELVRVGEAYQRVTGWHLRTPPVVAEVAA
ncbi:amidase [Amycolatopsis samaneae]|uniref:Amidase n=1 Tax=Amycolatopsis samaneae TaxID=664691 RepID=A0ABW5GF87_9PSEU